MHAVVSRHALAILVLSIACGVAQIVIVLVIDADAPKRRLWALVGVHKVRRWPTSITTVRRLRGLEEGVTCVVRRNYHASWAVIIGAMASLIVHTCWSIEHWILLVNKVRALPTQHFVLTLAWLIMTPSELVVAMVTVHIGAWLVWMAPKTCVQKARVHHLLVSIPLTSMDLGMSI